MLELLFDLIMLPFNIVGDIFSCMMTCFFLAMAFMCCAGVIFLFINV